MVRRPSLAAEILLLHIMTGPVKGDAFFECSRFAWLETGLAAKVLSAHAPNRPIANDLIFPVKITS